jgi:hypothetical protein
MNGELARKAIERFVYTHFIVYSDPRTEDTMLWDEEDISIQEEASYGLDTLHYDQSIFHLYDGLWMVRSGVVSKWTDPFKESKTNVSTIRRQNSALLTCLGFYPLTPGANSQVDEFIEVSRMDGAAGFRTWYTYSPESVVFVLLTGSSRACELFRSMMRLDSPRNFRSVKSISHYIITQLDA